MASEYRFWVFRLLFNLNPSNWQIKAVSPSYFSEVSGQTSALDIKATKRLNASIEL
jgi:hypothetical protein